MEMLIATAALSALAGAGGYALGRTARSSRADMEAADARWEMSVLEDAVRQHAPEALSAIRAEKQAHNRNRRRPE